jgi:AraC family transcriptional regulator
MALKELPGVDLAKEDGASILYPNTALLSSALTDRNGFHLQYHRQPPYEMAKHSCKQHRIIIHDRTLRSPMITAINEQTQLTQISSGTITVVPANAWNWACWNAEHQFIVLALEIDLWKQIIAENANANNIELLPTLGHSDTLIYNLGLALKAELEFDGIGSCLYLDALKTALLTHLLRHYSAEKYAPLIVKNGLSQNNLQQVISYIQDRLEQNLTLSELAAVAHISPSYFSGLFKQSTGLAPHQYVIQCRIERAKQLLREGKRTIAEIAQDLGFAHQSHLNRHFKRLVGVTPKAFLKSQ